MEICVFGAATPARSGVTTRSAPNLGQWAGTTEKAGGIPRGGGSKKRQILFKNL